MIPFGGRCNLYMEYIFIIMYLYGIMTEQFWRFSALRFLYKRHFGRVDVVDVAFDRFDAIDAGAKESVPYSGLFRVVVALSPALSVV